MEKKACCLIVVGASFALMSADITLTPSILSDTYPKETPLKIIEPMAAGVGDIDGDGLHEAIILKSSGGIYLLDYRGGGTYAMATIAKDVQFHFGRYPGIPILIEDFNGDNRKDFAADYYTFINEGNGLFAVTPLPNEAGSAKCAFDADRDGDADLLCHGYRGLSLLKNDGKGNYNHIEIDKGLTIFNNDPLMTLDWDKDGDTDVFCYDRSTPVSAFAVYVNDGNGGFVRRDVMAAKSVHGYRPIDFDLDGDFDLAMVDSLSSSELRLYEQLPPFFSGCTPYSQILASQNGCWYAIDMDHDGIADIYPSAGMCWVKNNGDRTMSPNFISTATGAECSVPFDYDNDGDIDFLGFRYIHTGSVEPVGYVAWYLNNLAPEILSPFAGKIVVSGTNDTVVWKSAYSGKVKLRYTANAGKTWTIVSDSTGNKGNYIWNVPQITSDSCRIEICDSRTNTLKDTSNGYFRIAQGKFFITAPNDNDTLVIGDTGIIKWTTIGKAGPVVILYADSSDSLVWKPIVSGIDNTGEYIWHVKNIPVSAVRIKIQSVTPPAVQSDNKVRITILPAPAIRVISPNGGEMQHASMPVVLQWSSTVLDSKLRAYLSVDSGATWEFFADSLPKNGQLSKHGSFHFSYNYCFAKLTRIKNESCYDISDSAFSILSSASLPESGMVWGPGISIIFKEQSRQLLVRSNGRGKSPVSIALYSLSGKRIVSVAPRIYPAGTHAVGLGMETISPGVYFFETRGVTGKPVDKIVMK